MKRSFITVKPHGQSGISRVEAIVVICIVAIVVAVVAPGIQGTRQRRARPGECINNMHQIGIAIQNFASSNDGSLPDLALPRIITNESGSQGTLVHGWPIVLLPALDNSKLLKNIRSHAVVTSDRSSDATAEMGPNERIWVSGFACPDDTDSHEQPGGLSYIVNIGFLPRSLYHGDPTGLHRLGGLSWNDNDEADEHEDIEIAAATGVIWRPLKPFRPSLDDPEPFKPSLDNVGEGDGTSHTLLLTENLQAGNWWDTETTRLGFGLPVPDVNGRVTFGKGAFFESPSQPLNTIFEGGTLTTAKPKDWTINSDLKAATGTRPRPSSNHQGGVNVILCDGSGRPLNENIDPHIYVRLLTPNGVAYGERKLQQSDF